MTQQDDITQPVLTDDEILLTMRAHLNYGDGGYVCDTAPETVIAAGRALLSKLRAPVADDRLADRLDRMAFAQPTGSQAQSDLLAAATIWRKHVNRSASAPVAKPWPAEEQPDGAVTPVDPVDMASAPVADERAALEKWMVVDGDMRDPEGLITYHAAAFREGLAIGRAALASAPVAKLPRIDPEPHTGEDYPIPVIGTAPVAREARRLPTINVGGKEHPQQWFTAKEVRQLLDAAPQASAEDDREALAHKVNLLTAESLGHRSAAGHLSALVDELSGHLIEARQAMADFQQAFVPAFDTPETLTMVPNEALVPFCAVLDRLRGLDLPQADKDGGQQRAGDVERLRRIAWLIGSIFVHGDFKAETANERELEKLLRENGTLWESLEQFDSAFAALSATQPEQGERDAK